MNPPQWSRVTGGARVAAGAVAQERRQVFLSVPIGTLVVFAILAGSALYNRRRSETHKRLMLLATIALLTPARARGSPRRVADPLTVG